VRTLLLLFVLALDACRCSGTSNTDRLASSVSTELRRVDAGNVVRFIAVGDTGKANAGQYQVGTAMASVCAKMGCDFVTLLGDNFYPSGVSSTSDQLWQSAFVKPYEKVNAPFYAVLGNHDYGGDGAGWELVKSAAQLEYAKVNNKWILPAHHYKFQIANAEFFAADTNRSMLGLDAAMRSDFASWLTASSAQWKIVFAHHPYLSNGPHGNSGAYDGAPLLQLGVGVKQFVEEDVCGRADLYLSGHDHDLQWLSPTCTRNDSNIKTEFLVSGAGATNTGFPNSPTNAVHFQADTLGFVYVVIAGDTLTGIFFDQNGTAVFSRTLTK
jgi:tartrate-resistant acid phosphatase type 5